MEERWELIDSFPDYEVSNFGDVLSYRTGKILSQSVNQFGLVHVGLVRDKKQYHRSIPLLVANAFLIEPGGAFDTPINLDGDRFNNRVDNLVWRPRWFAIKYNKQFKYPYDQPITLPIVDLKTGEVTANSFECAKKYGLLESEVVYSILNRMYVWPTYQEFAIME
jgi:hypothetical protein